MSKGRRDEPEINKFSFPLLFQLVHDGVVRPGVDEVVADLVHALHHGLQGGGGGAAWWGDRREGAGEGSVAACILSKRVRYHYLLERTAS